MPVVIFIKLVSFFFFLCDLNSHISADSISKDFALSMIMWISLDNLFCKLFTGFLHPNQGKFVLLKWKKK